MKTLSIGIVGLPNVGKSTLFKVLTKQEVNIANYPFATIDPNVGVVAVPDERLLKLAELSRSKKIIPAVMEFYDIAGLVKGAHKGEGLGNQFLSHIKETQAIVVVLRVFHNAEIIHVENSVDPMRDLEIINTELILKDLEAVEKRLAKAEAEARSGNKEALVLLEALRKIKILLENGKLLSSAITSDKQHSHILENMRMLVMPEMSAMNLLTAKRQIYLLNGKEEEVDEVLKNKIRELKGDYIIADLSNEESVPQLIKKAYEILDLISFFTTGEDETRAWTIKKGTLLPQASGVIHTDFEKKFIGAEVVPWGELLEAGSPSTVSPSAVSSGPKSSGQSNYWNAAKQEGLIKLEGKDYAVQDGDVVVVRHG